MDPGREAAEDALRDAVALVRAVLDGDDEALTVVAENASWPALTMGVLADWIAGLMQARGIGREALDEWQQAAGLR